MPKTIMGIKVKSQSGSLILKDSSKFFIPEWDRVLFAATSQAYIDSVEIKEKSVTITHKNPNMHGNYDDTFQESTIWIGIDSPDNDITFDLIKNDDDSGEIRLVTPAADLWSTKKSEYNKSILLYPPAQ